MNNIKEAIKQAPDTAEAYLYSLAHKYARKAYQEAKKVIKAAKLEQSVAKTPEAKSDADVILGNAESEVKTLGSDVVKNFNQLLSHVGL